MSLTIGLHGGMCCGIKHIYSLDNSPSNTCYTKEKTSKEYLSSDRDGSTFEVGWNFYWKSRPKETYGERFAAYIDYLAEVRRYGLVEVAIIVPVQSSFETLSGETMDELELGLIPTFEEAVDVAKHWADDDDEYRADDYNAGGNIIWYNQEEWVPVLEEHGFRMVSQFPNINSGNLVQVWHLVMDGEYHKNRKGK